MYLKNKLVAALAIAFFVVPGIALVHATTVVPVATPSITLTYPVGGGGS